jgi:DNA repair exonuclease SbcCD nuclease subunit
MVRFLHTADWQLGMTRHFLDADAQPRFSDARIEAIRTIGALAEAERCELVVVCGDVFETNHVDRQAVVRALDAMAATPNIRFFLLPGNHDPLDAASVFRTSTFTAHQPANVVVLDGTEPVAIRPGVELVAAPWTTKRPTVDLVGTAVANLTDDGTVRIVVGHGAFDVDSPDTANPGLLRLAAAEEAIARGRVAYVALGDRHSTTSVGTTDRIFYAGAPEPTDFREIDPGNVLIVEVDHTGCSVTPHRVGTWQFERRTVHLTGASDVDHLDQELRALPHKARTIVKLILIGQLTLLEHARLQTVLAHHGELLASLDHDGAGSDLVVVPDETELATLDLSGFAAAALEDLRVEAVEHHSAAAQGALGLLVRLARSEDGP